jgi:hypothetical protein
VKSKSRERSAGLKNILKKQGELMTEPIGSPSQLPPPQQTPSVITVSQQMQDQVIALADHLQKILADPTLASQSSFLSAFANNVSNLNQTTHQALLLR